MLRRPDLPTLAGIVFGAAGALMVLGGIAMVFDDPAGFALIAFGLVFIGAGTLAYRLFRPPEGMKAITVSEHTHATERPFGVRGTRRQAVLIHVDEEATEAEIAEARQAWMREQWHARPDWIAGRIEDAHTHSGSNLYFAAVLWSVFAGGLILGFVLWGDPPWLLLAIPAGVALLLVVAAVRAHLRQRKFGSSHFQMAATPAFLGERLAGTVETGVEARHGPADGFRVRLACRNRYERRDSDGDTHLHVDTLWETEHVVTARTAPGLPRRLSVPIDLTLPADPPPTTLGTGREGVAWDLTVSAAVPGLDYAATFRLPVFDRSAYPDSVWGKEGD